MGRQKQPAGKDKKLSSPAENEGNQSSREYDRLAEEGEKVRTRKPGSQGNAANRHNNGRGGGK